VTILGKEIIFAKLGSFLDFAMERNGNTERDILFFSPLK